MIKEKQRQNGPADKYELTPWRTEYVYVFTYTMTVEENMMGLT